MSKVGNEILLEQLKWRYACKKFDPTKKINEADLNVLIETLRLSASSHGLQPWKFIIVQNPELRQELMKHSWGNTPVTEASHLIVFTYLAKLDEAHIDKHVTHTAKIREIDITALSRYRDGMIRDMVQGPRSQTIEAWAQRQTYLAMGSLLTTAALMQIDTLPMEGIIPAEYDEVLRLKNTGWKTVGAVACGYRAADDKYQHIKKVRFDLDDVVEYR